MFFIFNEHILDTLKNNALTHISSVHPELKIEINQNNSVENNYYSDLRFNIFATNSSGKEYFLIDGGFTDWTQQLLSNKKERLFTSGFGIERFIYCFEDKNN